jgi:hypothetical protein
VWKLNPEKEKEKTDAAYCIGIMFFHGNVDEPTVFMFYGRI